MVRIDHFERRVELYILYSLTLLCSQEHRQRSTR